MKLAGKFHLIIIIISFACQMMGQTSQEIIEASITYHDPQNLLQSKPLQFTIKETRPNGADRKSNIVIDIVKQHTIMERTADEVHTIIALKKDKINYLLNGSSTITEEDKEANRLTEERSRSMASYYRYLWHLPRTLQDPGAIIESAPQSKEFNGEKAYEVKVTYSPEVGKDIWYYYFNPENYALVGYRFYHDESKNDGEYIVLSGETSYQSLRIPQTREWYTHDGDKFLGADILENIQLFK